MLLRSRKSLIFCLILLAVPMVASSVFCCSFADLFQRFEQKEEFCGH